MGFLDKLLGRDDPQDGATPQQGQQQAPQQAGQRPGGRTDDEIAVERYRYLLRTAPPETIEQVHAEAFATLTPEQRRTVFDELSRQSPQGEQPRGDDAGSLAQAATRSELRRPGTLEQTLGGGQQGAQAGAGQAPGRQGGGMGMGSIIGGSLLGTVAGYVIGSALVSSFLPDGGDATADGGDAGDAGAEGDAGADGGADGGAGADAGSDPQLAGDATGGDPGAAGDFGGGDFGGGFGGGDFGGFGDFDI
ncbi:hypothetical protein IFT90_04915 [Frigoribacterium sp. CFBP 8766]|uniref:hypothetical protein n=1 Tax=Frigoribacterium sp. CFBP 8766 TaxID=2775273 RepID=UPI0017829BDD|nr:hypothetical protein [Frigoribacterium sp. CFBP 8766]MBD8583897.1 hypothetical protein [Frigoribacterium sp. CFBP 8766]